MEIAGREMTIETGRLAEQASGACYVRYSDQENEPEILSIIGASAAMCLSDVPFAGPIGAAKVGYINGEYILNPTAQQLQESELELSISGTADAVSMVEAGAQELPEEILLEAIRFGFEQGIKPTVELQQRM